MKISVSKMHLLILVNKIMSYFAFVCFSVISVHAFSLFSQNPMLINII